MDADSSVVKARGREAGAGWRWAKVWKMGDVCNSIHNLKKRICFQVINMHQDSPSTHSFLFLKLLLCVRPYSGSGDRVVSETDEETVPW